MKPIQSIATVMFLSVVCFAQAAPQSQAEKTSPAPAAQSPSPKTKQPGEQPVPPDAPVVKVTGLCSQPAPEGTCQTVITKKEFDDLVEAVNPKLNPSQRRELANVYVQMLVLANEGEKAGAEKDPTFQERLKLERLKMLAQAAEKHLHDTTEPTQQQIDVFYAQNRNLFEQMHLLRVTIPKTVNGGFNDAAAKSLAAKIRARATEGEDMALLQGEVWTTEKTKGTPPKPDLGWKRRGTVDQRHEPQLLNLKQGEISPVLHDAQNYYVYKVAEKKSVPLQEVQQDIAAALQQQIFSEKIKSLLESVKTDLNVSYFGAEPETGVPQTPSEEKPPTPRP